MENVGANTKAAIEFVLEGVLAYIEINNKVRTKQSYTVDVVTNYPSMNDL
jgi:hypothetical protein